MTTSVLVAHSGRQHSHQLAQALHEHEMLAGYWTGVPAADPDDRGLLYRLIAEASPQPTLNLPSRRIRHNYVAPLVRRVVERVLSASSAQWWTHKSDAWFDQWCAQRLPPDIDAVVAYENSALETFRTAKEQETTTILDAASFHHAWQDEFYEPVESDEAHAAINRRKDAEIARADHVLTVSELARESYLDAGVPPQQVTAVHMGADLSAFHPPEDPLDRSDPFTFLFAGHVERRKGADVLFSASDRLHRNKIEHRVQLAGSVVDDTLNVEEHPSVEALGYLDQSVLNTAFQRADCLVLPSRHDSFGRVVVEGMATGLPALVTEHVGAKEAIDERVTGWIVPAEDVDALAEQMRWCIKHPDVVREMRDDTVEVARNYTWSSYRDRVTDVIDSIVEDARVSARTSPEGMGV